MIVQVTMDSRGDGISAFSVDHRSQRHHQMIQEASRITATLKKQKTCDASTGNVVNQRGRT
jgi:hypothetical protein